MNESKQNKSTKSKYLVNQTIPILRFLLIVCLLKISVHSSNAQWEMAMGLDGGRLDQMVSIDTMLFAVAKERGVFSKSDNGKWELVFDHFYSPNIAKAGNCIFITAYYENCMRSCDNGISWETVPNLNSSSRIWSIDTVIFFYNSSGFKRSFDFGESFESIGFSTPYYIESTLCDDSLLYIIVYDGYEYHEIHCSNDYGDTWDTIPVDGLFPIPYAEVEQIEYLNGQLWAQTHEMSAPASRKLIYLFNDDLKEWIDVKRNIPFWGSHKDLYEYRGEIFCSIYSYPVFKFNPEDTSWVEFTDGSRQVNQFLTHQGQLYCATEQGACSLDTSGNWTSYYTGLQHRNVSSIAMLDDKVYVTANNELFYSFYGSYLFERDENAYGFEIIVTDSVFYMISAHEYKMSWDRGETWHSFSDNIDDTEYSPRVTDLCITSDYYYVGTTRGLFRSSTDSISWIEYLDDPFYTNFWVNYVEAIDKTVFVGRGWWGRDVFFSFDNGYNFYNYDEYCRIKTIDHCYFKLKDSIYYSDDLAFSWNLIPVPISGYDGYCIDKKDDIIITGGHANGNRLIQLTDDYGEHWIDLIDDLPFQTYYYENIIKNLKIVDYRLYAGNPGYGLWYRDDLLTGLVENPPAGTAENSLVKIYPNPASDFLIIEAECVINTVRIIDQAGRVLNHAENINNARTRIDLEGLKDGVYYVRMKTEKGIYCRKFVIMK